MITSQLIDLFGFLIDLFVAIGTLSLFHRPPAALRVSVELVRDLHTSQLFVDAYKARRPRGVENHLMRFRYCAKVFIVE